MLWELVKSIILFWFSSVSLIFIAMILLFSLSYLYDYFMWPRNTPSMLGVPPTIIVNTTPRVELGHTNSSISIAEEFVPATTSKKGAKWKKCSKKSAEKREKEIQSTDYETSNESLNVLNKQRKTDEAKKREKNIVTGNYTDSESTLPTIRTADNESFPVTERFGRFEINYDESDESLLESETQADTKFDSNSTDAIYSPSCIPLSTQSPKSNQCVTKSITSHTIDTYKEITSNSDAREVAMFSPSPHIALTGPGPGSFVANRAEPIITPSAYIDPPIYGNIMPVFHVEQIPSQTICSPDSPITAEKVDAKTQETVGEGGPKLTR